MWRLYKNGQYRVSTPIPDVTMCLANGTMQNGSHLYQIQLKKVKIIIHNRKQRKRNNMQMKKVILNAHNHKNKKKDAKCL